MHPRPIANLLLTATLLVQPSNCLPADQQRHRRRIRSSTPHKAPPAAENNHVFRHNFLDVKDTQGNSEPLLPSARIVGGTETRPNRHPYMVSLQKVVTRQAVGGTTLVFFAQKCGGTLIADDIVLTAAHCVDCAAREDPESCYDRIVLGRHDLRSYDEMRFVEEAGVFVGKSESGGTNETASTNSTGTTSADAGNQTSQDTPSWDDDGVGRLKFDRDEVTTYIHPLYERDHRSGAQYDFALIKLPTRAYHETATGGSLSPIQLNADPAIPSANGQPLTIAGWGSTKASSADNGSAVSPVLLEATVPYLDNAKCRQVEGYVGSTLYSYNDIVNPCMMCAVSPEPNGPDACSGDSGGPLFVRGTAGDGSDDVQVGIVSFGVECGNPKFPGVYARISEAYDWISQTVCSSSNHPATNFGCAPSASPTDRPSLRGTSDRPSLPPTGAPSVITGTPTSLQPSDKPTRADADSDSPSSVPSWNPSERSTPAPTTIMDQIFLVPEKLERSGALQSQVLLAGMAEDELQASARIDLTPPTAKPSPGPTAWARTGKPSGQPVSMTNNIFEEAELPSSGSPRAFISQPLLLVCALSSLGLYLLAL